MQQFQELMIVRSLYHLREADPHTFAIPRLTGRAKAALLEIQCDEYGGGQFERMHATLFATTMTALGLDSTPGAYLEQAPAVVLALNNVMSLFAVHRRWRAALLGQLAVFEMNSSAPNRRYGNGLRRLGGTPEATRFFDEHVEADAVHEQIAAHAMCAEFCRQQPDQTATLLLGAAAFLQIEALVNRHLMDAWQHGASALRLPAATAV
jgi:pyrroloquinoline quinone (PQQ) biosynthesis protein C